MLNEGRQRFRWSCLSELASPERWECLGWPDKKPGYPLICAESIPLWRGFRVHVELRQRWRPPLGRFPVYKRIGQHSHRATRVQLRVSDRTEDPLNQSLYSFREQLYSI